MQASEYVLIRDKQMYYLYKRDDAIQILTVLLHT